MTNQKAIAKARKLLLPVAESLAKRRPAGMSNASTDLSLALVRDCVSKLSITLELFEGAVPNRRSRERHDEEKIEECGA